LYLGGWSQPSSDACSTRFVSPDRLDELLTPEARLVHRRGQSCIHRLERHELPLQRQCVMVA
jgi:hypothetical protein